MKIILTVSALLLTLVFVGFQSAAKHKAYTYKVIQLEFGNSMIVTSPTPLYNVGESVWVNDTAINNADSNGMLAIIVAKY